MRAAHSPIVAGRELVATHARAANEALVRADKRGADYERERGIATNELLKTLALDPTNDEHVAALGHFLASPPRVLPAAVVAEITEVASRSFRTWSI